MYTKNRILTGGIAALLITWLVPMRHSTRGTFALKYVACCQKFRCRQRLTS